MTGPIRQELTFESTPDAIYEALTDASRFSAMSGGAPAEIDPTPGGAFSCFGGMITGRIVECSPGKRLVQAWRAKPWEPGLYSIVRFELAVDGEKTRVVMEHAGFPEEQREHLAQGWQANYWEPLRKLVA
ncbi:MAG: SRPBCC family protein [Polyangiales bacterium]